MKNWASQSAFLVFVAGSACGEGEPVDVVPTDDPIEETLTTRPDTTQPDTTRPDTSDSPVVELVNLATEVTERDSVQVELSEACAATVVKAPLIREAVDLIVVVDNSASMGEELAAVERNINEGLAQVLQNAGADYRLILISRHRNFIRDGFSDTAICIESPLSGLASCQAAPEPVFSARFFHYSTLVQSDDSLALLVDAYEPPFEFRDRRDGFGNAKEGWAPWLRQGVRKVFLEISDDESSLTADAFIQAMTQLDTESFGTFEEPAFVFHSIVGLRPNDIPEEPYEADSPLVRTSCSRGELAGRKPGLEYQRLSQATGGLRFPICETNNYDSVFRQIAGDTLLAGTLDCQFAIPTPFGDLEVVNDRIGLQVQPGSGTPPYALKQLSNSGECSKNGFFLFEGKIELCPQICDELVRDPLAQVEVLFACESTLR